MACPQNKVNCPCTYAGCPRHGKCCECVAYHRRNDEFPGCFYSKEGEAAWDRSFECLAQDRKKG